MSERIFKNILAVVMAVLAACLVLIMSIMYSYFSESTWRGLEAEASFIGAGVEASGMEYLQELDTFDGTRVTWIGQDGDVLFDSVSDSETMENHAQREEVVAAREAGSGKSERYSSTLSEKTIYFARLLEDGTVLRVSNTQSSMVSLLLDMSEPMIFIIVAAVLVSMFLAYRIARKIVQPINEMDLEHPMENQTYRELQPLLQRLEKQYERIEHEMEDKEKLRREFSANVSHELKTPLTSISGIAEIMQNGMVRSEDVPHFAGNIYKESQRLIALVEDIIKISQLDENQVLMDQEQVNLAEVAAQEIERVTPAAKQRNILIRLHAPMAYEAQPVVTGIRQILREMIYNLLDNAVKYNKEGGSIDVMLRTQGEHIVLSVADTGIGIPEEDQQRVFERFYRVDKSHSKAIGGTGLGLSIVKHGALYHQAQIDLKSELGKGTQITITFKKKSRNK